MKPIPSCVGCGGTDRARWSCPKHREGHLVCERCDQVLWTFQRGAANPLAGDLCPKEILVGMKLAGELETEEKEKKEEVEADSED